MTDKELIKQEIERLYTEVSQKPYNGEIEGEMCAYDKLDFACVTKVAVVVHYNLPVVLRYVYELAYHGSNHFRPVDGDSCIHTIGKKAVEHLTVGSVWVVDVVLDI